MTDQAHDNTERVWWEKTVEYLFVLKNLKENQLAYPLDGKHEKAGDTILKLGLDWLLIEFKKDDSCLDSEKTKFSGNDWELVTTYFPEDKHHLLVYGALDEKKLVLEAKTYFSRNSITLSEFSNFAIPHDEFKEYLDRLLKWKSSESGTDSGGMSFDSYTHVMGVDEKGEVMAVEEANKFAILLDLKKELTKTYTPAGAKGPGW